MRLRDHRRYVNAAVLFCLSVLAVIALGVVSGTRLSSLRDLVLRIDFLPFLIIAVVQAAIIALAAYKWQIILGRVRAPRGSLPLREAFRATILGTLGGQVLPMQLVTPAVRAIAGRRFGIQASTAVGTSVFEQVFEVIVLGSMAGAAIVLASADTGIAGIAIGGGVAAFAATVAIKPVLRAVRCAVDWTAGRVFSAVATRVRVLSDALDQIRRFPAPELAVLTGLSFLRYAGLVGLNVWILHVLVPQVAVTPLILAFPVVLAVMTVPVVPAGLGVLEATWSGVLIANGVDAATAVEAAIGLRIISTSAFLLTVPVVMAMPRVAATGAQ